MQRLRSIQRPSAGGADAKDKKDKLNRPNAQLLHPVNNLSIIGSRAARSPLGPHFVLSIFDAPGFVPRARRNAVAGSSVVRQSNPAIAGFAANQVFQT
jgi:hypothetical protein